MDTEAPDSLSREIARYRAMTLSARGMRELVVVSRAVRVPADDVGGCWERLELVRRWLELAQGAAEQSRSEQAQRLVEDFQQTYREVREILACIRGELRK